MSGVLQRAPDDGGGDPRGTATSADPTAGEGRPTFNNLPRDKPHPEAERFVLEKEGEIWYERRSPDQRIVAQGRYDFVVQDGKLWSARSQTPMEAMPGHTEAAAGRPADYAGTIQFGRNQKAGRLIRWTNESGHYAPAATFWKAAGLDKDFFEAIKPEHRSSRGPQLPTFPPKPGEKLVPAGRGGDVKRIGTREPEPVPQRTIVTGEFQARDPGGGSPPSSPAPKVPPTPTVSPAPAVAAKDVAGALARSERQTRRMELAAVAVRSILSAWNAYNVLEDAADAMKASAATLAHESPYWQQIQEAANVEARAGELDRYYGSLNILKDQMPSKAAGSPEWDSWSDLREIQLAYVLIEQHLREAWEAIDDARASLAGMPKRDWMPEWMSEGHAGQIAELRDAMASKMTAIAMMPVTSLVYADAMQFAEAGGKMNRSLLSAVDHYASAQGWLEHHERLAQAAIKGLELRLRELGEGGIFYDMSTDEVRSAPLGRFSLTPR